MVVCPSPDGQKPLRGAHCPAWRVEVLPEVAVHTNPRVCSRVRHHRSNGITQQVEHPHGSRAAQRSGALGLSSAEVTMLKQLDADTREIITLLLGEKHTRINPDALRSHRSDHVGNVPDKTIRGILVDAQFNRRHSSMEPNAVSIGFFASWPRAVPVTMGHEQFAADVLDSLPWYPYNEGNT
jgi:hypothetical protein